MYGLTHVLYLTVLRSTSTSAEGKGWEEKLTKLLNLIVKDERTSGAVSGRKTTEKMHHPKAVSPEMRLVF